jgi:hypothetical protein
MARRELQAVRLSLGSAVALGLARFAYGLVVPAMRDAVVGGCGSTANGVGYLAGAVVVAMIVRRLSAAQSFQLGMVVTTLSWQPQPRLRITCSSCC